MRTILMMMNPTAWNPLTTELGVYCPEIEITWNFYRSQKGAGLYKTKTGTGIPGYWNAFFERFWSSATMPGRSIKVILLQLTINMPLKHLTLMPSTTYSPVMKSKLVCRPKALDKQITQIDLEQLQSFNE